MIDQTVSHYRLLNKIGSGGMGEVYLAEDMKLKRQVALKFLARQMTADPEARERFEREAQAAAALNHPNIVTIYEIGEHKGQVFIAMEYVEGRTLKELITVNRTPSTVNRIPIPEVLDIAMQIASGLAAAHAKGIVHRDVKPQNIVIDRDGLVKILDFGLAKLQGASRLTQEALAMGTVHYMSPEQGMGKEVDQRTDIWSLGVVLHEMLSGEPPFHGDYDQAVIYAIVNEEMAPLPEAVRKECPALEEIICRCLAKKRQERYVSAAELATALRELAGAKEATKPEPSTRSQLSRRSFLTAISLLLLSGLLGFLALSPKARFALGKTFGLAGIPRERHMAVLPIVAAGDDGAQALGDGFTAVLIDKLIWLEKFHDSMWTVPAGEVFANRAKPARDLQRLWGCNLFIEGSLQEEKRSLRLRLNLVDARTGKILERSEIQGHMANLSLFQDGLLARLLRLLELPETSEAARAVNFGGTSLPGAYAFYLKGRGLVLGEANIPGIDRGIGLLEKSLRQDHRYLLARLALLEAWRIKSRLARNPEWLRLGESQWNLLRQADSRWALPRLAWGRLLMEHDRSAEARQAFLGVLDLFPRCYEAHVWLAICSANAGDNTEAEGYYKRAIGLRPGYPKAYEQLAYFYHANGRFDEALLLYQQASEMAPGDPQVFGNLGAMHLIRGEREQAKAAFERSIAIQPNASAQSNLALIHYYDGEFRQALPLHLEAARNSREHYEWGNLADTCRQLPELKAKAAEAYRRAIALAEPLLASRPDDPELISSLALYYVHAGEKQKSLTAISRARSLAPAFMPGIQRAVLVYEAAGERSQALTALREYLERLGRLEDIEREPDLAALRSDPAYREIVRKRQ